MTIDILSDLHLDFYFRTSGVDEDTVKTRLSHIFKDHVPADMLIVTGDLGHDNDQNAVILHYLKKIYGYKYIICVLGNHDYYLINTSNKSDYAFNSINRVEGMRNMINNQENMFCLNGEIIEIEGIRIGGCDSWYDGSYIKKHFNRTDDTWINQLWKHSLNDANYILGVTWQDLWQQEKEKIEKIYQEVDIMITHVNPSIAKKHTDRKYQEELTTGFFCFDGEKYLKQGSMKYWIYGHTHDAMEYELHGVKCICNPLGYPGEANTTLRQIEIVHNP